MVTGIWMALSNKMNVRVNACLWTLALALCFCSLLPGVLFLLSLNL